MLFKVLSREKDVSKNIVLNLSRKRKLYSKHTVNKQELLTFVHSII